MAQVRTALATTAALLSALPEIIWQAAGAELGSLLGELDRVAALAAAGRVAVTAEAVQRGEVAASQCASAAGWVGQHARRRWRARAARVKSPNVPSSSASPGCIR